MLQGNREFAGMFNVTNLKTGRLSWIIQMDPILRMILKSRELSQAGSGRELKEKPESSKPEEDSLHDCCSEIQGSRFK